MKTLRRCEVDPKASFRNTKFKVNEIRSNFGFKWINLIVFFLMLQQMHCRLSANPGKSLSSSESGSGRMKCSAVWRNSLLV